MTPEQFVYWLCGHLTGSRDNDAEAIVDDIKAALKQVRINTSQVLYYGEE